MQKAKERLYFRFFFFFFFLFFLRPHLRHMEVPRLGVNKEPQLPAYTTATDSNARSEPHVRPTPWLTATPDP